MFSNDLNNAYAYEIERRKDEMRDAANSQVERECLGKRKPAAPTILKKIVLRIAPATLVIIVLIQLYISG